MRPRCSLLVEICGASRWLAEELSHHPVLLDELLDPGLLYTIPDIEALRVDLRARLAFAERSGEEAELEALRSFKETHQFRVAACEVRGILPLMNVSDYLTFLAEVILREALTTRLEAHRRHDACAPPNRSRSSASASSAGSNLVPVPISTSSSCTTSIRSTTRSCTGWCGDCCTSSRHAHTLARCTTSTHDCGHRASPERWSVH